MRRGKLLFIILMMCILGGCSDNGSSQNGINDYLEYDLNENDMLQDYTGIDEIYYVCNTDSGLQGLYDCDSQKYIVEPAYMNIGQFSSEGLAPVCRDGYYGYLNSYGEIVIDFYFTRADSFQNGYAVVGTENGCGVIDSTGAYTVNPQYAELSWLNDTLLQYRLADSQEYGLCNLAGKQLSEPDYEYFTWKEEYLFAKIQEGDNKFEVFDKEGNALFGEGTALSQVVCIIDSSEGPYLAECKGTSDANKYGFIYTPSQMYDEWYSYLTRDFQLLPGDPYQEARTFNSSGYAIVAVRQDWWGHKIWGVIDDKGNYICDLPDVDLGEADDYYLDTNGYFAFAGGYTGSYGMNIEQRYAIVDLNTQAVYEYQSVAFISGTDYTVVQDISTGLYGLYDKNEQIKECVYESITEGADKTMVLKRGGTEEIYGKDSGI